MNTYTKKQAMIKLSITFLLLIGWHQAQSCEITQNSLGMTVYIDCFKIDDQPKIKMPNLRVKSTSIQIAAGGGTGFEVGFEIENSGQQDSDRGLYYSGYSLNSYNPGFYVDTAVYAVSEDHSVNMHYDNDTSQWMPYTKTRTRINKLAAGSTWSYFFGSSASPRFFLYDRNLTYKIGLAIIVDDPHAFSSTTSGVSHGEVIESNESDNNLTYECLVYGYNISDLSEILSIKHFHINNDLNLPLVGPC